VQILSALFVEDIATRQVPGPSTRIDLGGVMFSMPAPSPPPLTLTPHLVVIVRCDATENGNDVLEVVFRDAAGEQVARNVQPLAVEPGKFSYRLVRGELLFPDYCTLFAHCRTSQGEPVIVPLTLLAPG